jgi:hypothetical protein
MTLPMTAWFVSFTSVFGYLRFAKNLATFAASKKISCRIDRWWAAKRRPSHSVRSAAKSLSSVDLYPKLSLVASLSKKERGRSCFGKGAM